MAKSRDEERARLTAQAEGGTAVADVPQSAAGLRESGYWRVSLPHGPEMVVKAIDRANALSTYFRQMGIIATEHSPEILPASRQEYITAQARRFRIDLREQPDWEPPQDSEEGN